MEAGLDAAQESLTRTSEDSPGSSRVENAIASQPTAIDQDSDQLAGAFKCENIKLSSYRSVGTQTWLPNGDPCDICHQINEAVHSKPENWCRRKLCTISEFLQSSCQTHRPFLRPWAAKINPMKTPDDVVLLERRHRTTAELRFEVEQPDGQRRLYTNSLIWVLVQECSGIQDLGAGLIVNPEWTDLKLVQSWYDRCTNHHDCCNQRANWQDGLDVAPYWLVDVAAGCLVKGRLGARYVALSYVWGSPEVSRHFLQTTHSNIDMLQKPGALLRGEFFDRMSATVRDALQLTRLLEVPYFWADALCIVQDDPIDIKQPYLDNMGSIYTNSAFTIKATNSRDASDGLRGIRELQFPTARSCEQHIVPFGPEQRFIQIPSYDPYCRENIWGSRHKYHTRAWTYQESILSRKYLSFLEGMVYWQCDGGWWTEELIDQPLGCDLGNTFLHAIRYPYETRAPSLLFFGQMIYDYNPKQLTYESDRFDAFAGMAKLLSRAFGQLQSGLPEMFFDITLLWQPEKYHTRAGVRRRHTDLGEVAQGKKKALPSWSWAGWQCVVDYWPWTTAGGTKSTWTVLGEDTWHEVIPIVEWSVSHGLDTESQHDRCKIVTAWRYINSYNHDITNMPEGWERSENSDRLPDGERQTLYSSWDRPFVYRIAKTSGRDQFFCPITVPVLRPDARPEYPPYLHGRVQRAWLTCEDEFVLIPDATAIVSGITMAPGCFLLSDDGDRIGWLRLCSDTELDDGITVAQVLQRESRRVELIALSRDVVQLTKPSRKGERWITRPAGPLEESYNVMWIGWSGRVALRRALGKVQQQAWERLARDMVDITLA